MNDARMWWSSLCTCGRDDRGQLARVPGSMAMLCVMVGTYVFGSCTSVSILLLFFVDARIVWIYDGLYIVKPCFCSL